MVRGWRRMTEDGRGAAAGGLWERGEGMQEGWGLEGEGSAGAAPRLAQNAPSDSAGERGCGGAERDGEGRREGRRQGKGPGGGAEIHPVSA